VLHGRAAEAESQAGIVGAAALELARLHALVVRGIRPGVSLTPSPSASGCALLSAKKNGAAPSQRRAVFIETSLLDQSPPQAPAPEQIIFF
jgi:hypothetical protein